MNKLKWVPLDKEVNLNVPSMLCDKNVNEIVSSISNDNYVKVFYIKNNIVVCFIWEKVIFLELKEKENNFSLEIMYCTQLNFLSNHNEFIIGIKQISYWDVSPTKFALISNDHNVYCIDISLKDYYIELLCKISISQVENKNNVFLCQYVTHDTIIVKYDNCVYLYEIILRNRKLIYNGNDELIIHGEITNEYIVIFTSKCIMILNRNTFDIIKRIFSYETSFQHTFKGKVFKNKIMYIKSNDEFAIYDINDNSNNQSLKFSSKKKLNKFNFHKVIYVSDDIICLVNDSKSELYAYLQNIPAMNRESTIYDNRNYIITETHILIIGMNTKKLTMKAKIAKYKEKTNIININKQNENEITFPCLKEIENDYESKYKIIQNIKKEIKIQKHKIQFLLKIIKTNTKETFYFNAKHSIYILLTSLYHLYYSLDTPFLSKFHSLLHFIHFHLTIHYIHSFGSHSLILNTIHILLPYYINISISNVNNLLEIAINSNDSMSYSLLLNTKYKLNNLLQ